MRVPFLDLVSQHAALKEEILAAWANILDKAAFVGGEEVEAFEREFAMLCGSRYAVAVGTGTDALHLALLSLGLMPGDEVVTTPFTFIATAEAITQAGAKVVFADIDPETRTLSPKAFRDVLTPRTRAVVPVHMGGQPADMQGILDIADEHDVWVIEDAAQAHLAGYRGRIAGSMGFAGAFSFYPGKNLGACGEAGAVTTDDRELAATVRALREHGQFRKNEHAFEGRNSRCDALQAAALRVKLPHLAAWNDRRAELAALYSSLLDGVPGIEIPRVGEGTTPSWHLYAVLVERRNAVRQRLADAGIATGIHYETPLHLMAPYAYLGHVKGDFPESERVSSMALSLPIFPEMREEQVHYVTKVLRQAVEDLSRTSAEGEG